MPLDDEKSNIQLALAQNIDRAQRAEIAIDINQRVIQYSTPYLLWLHSQALQNKSSSFKKLVGGVGYVIGAVSTCSSYPLGADFAIALTSDTNSVGNQLFQAVCGVISIGPVAILMARVTKAEFDCLADLIEKKPPRLNNQDNNPKKRISTVLSHCFASFAGIPFYVLIKPYFVNIPVLNVLMPWTGMVSSYCACLGTEKDLIEKYFVRKHQEDTTIARLRTQWLDAFQNALTVLRDKSDIDLLHASIQEIIVQSTPEIATLKTLKLLLADCKTDELSGAVIRGNGTASLAKNALDAFALTMGGISILVFYQSGQQTTDLALENMGVTNATTMAVLDNFVAFIAILTNMLFDAMYAKYDTDRIYGAWNEGQRHPSFNAIFAMLIALGSCFPMAYLAIAQADNLLESFYTIPVFIGGALARDLAFYDLLCFLQMLWKRNATEGKRQYLSGILEKAGGGMTVLPENHLLLMNEALSEESALTQVDHASSQPALTIQTSNRAAFFAKSSPISVPLQSPAIHHAPRRRHSCP